LFQFCKDYLRSHKIDYFVFGHRHLPLDLDVDGRARYINLGEWINYNTYAVFDGQAMLLKTFEDERKI
jgi:UDP-2,3-diacylglucosamine hydrolase